MFEEGQSDKSDKTPAAWGRCRTCRLPGLALVWSWEQPAPGMPKCGFCGGILERTSADLSGEAAAVIAAPHRRTS